MKITIYFDEQHKFQEMLICRGRLLLSNGYFHTSLKVIPWEGEETETNDGKSEMAKLSSAWMLSLCFQPIWFVQTGNWIVQYFHLTDRLNGRDGVNQSQH